MNASEPPRRPQSVLFACTMNAVRSPMAEAIARHFFGKEIFFGSASVRQGKLDPFGPRVMEEIDIALQKHKPHTFEDLEDSSYDMIVSLSPWTYPRVFESTRTAAFYVVYLPTL